MRYYSTNDRYNEVSLRKAIMQSVASDGGVYMPDRIPVIPRALFNHIPEMSLREIGYVAATTLFGSDIEASDLNSIINDTLSFEIPLRQVTPTIYALELFHGPTGSFKDVGARFMARLVEFYNSGNDGGSPVNVVVATSGNTGNAVADAFTGIENVNVIIFHPRNTHLYHTAHGSRGSVRNIYPIGINGTFEQCQLIVKQIYADAELNERMHLTSANSINIARLLPQTIYFFHAYARLAELGLTTDGMTIATPCGNLGNLTAALFAKQMGLPLQRIIAAGRNNERLWGSIQDGLLSVTAFNNRALATNLARINNLITGNGELADIIRCHTFTADEISTQIADARERFGYLMDYRSAMAFKSLADASYTTPCVFLATARPYDARQRNKGASVSPYASLPADYARVKAHLNTHFTN